MKVAISRSTGRSLLNQSHNGMAKLDAPPISRLETLAQGSMRTPRVVPVTEFCFKEGSVFVPCSRFLFLAILYRQKVLIFSVQSLST